VIRARSGSDHRRDDDHRGLSEAWPGVIHAQRE
jgi:hypothetical protein